MRDNIKPIEAGFFKYCMKNLSYEYCTLNARIRDGKLMRDLMSGYSDANNIPFKVIYNIVNKWDAKGIFSWEGDVWGIFNPIKFPIEYIMLIPRRALRKVPAFGLIMDTDRCEDYALVFVFKTRANGLENTNAIRESRIDYWTDPAFTMEKYNTALLNINKIIDSSMKYNDVLLISCVSYILDAYNISRETILKDANLTNHTIHTLKKYIEFARTNRRAWDDAWKAKLGNFVSEVDVLTEEIFKDINCN